MYIRILSGKEEEKYLITQYYFLFYRFKLDLKNLLLTNDKSIKIKIKRIFEFFINKYDCSFDKRNEIINFLQALNNNALYNCRKN